jgi:hypothetical protein
VRKNAYTRPLGRLVYVQWGNDSTGALVHALVLKLPFGHGGQATSVRGQLGHTQWGFEGSGSLVSRCSSAGSRREHLIQMRR